MKLPLMLLFAAMVLLPEASFAEENESVEGLSSGGRWVAAALTESKPHRLLIMDKETGDVYEAGDFSNTEIESMNWASESELDLDLLYQAVRVKITPPTETGGAPGFEFISGTPQLTKSVAPRPPKSSDRGMKNFSESARRTQESLDRSAAMKSVTSREER